MDCLGFPRHTPFLQAADSARANQVADSARAIQIFKEADDRRRPRDFTPEAVGAPDVS